MGACTESGVHSMPVELLASSRLCRRDLYHAIEHPEAAEALLAHGPGVIGVDMTEITPKTRIWERVRKVVSSPCL